MCDIGGPENFAHYEPPVKIIKRSVCRARQVTHTCARARLISLLRANIDASPNYYRAAQCMALSFAWAARAVERKF